MLKNIPKLKKYAQYNVLNYSYDYGGSELPYGV